jgi:mRNA-degrading endonuclease toxin of MazEF toxin-antitoxin module
VKRGDVVTAAVKGDNATPRPAVVVQSDLFNDTHASITILPLTSTIVDAPLIRLRVIQDERMVSREYHRSRIVLGHEPRAASFPVDAAHTPATR